MSSNLDHLNLGLHRFQTPDRDVTTPIPDVFYTLNILKNALYSPKTAIALYSPSTGAQRHQSHRDRGLSHPLPSCVSQSRNDSLKTASDARPVAAASIGELAAGLGAIARASDRGGSDSVPTDPSRGSRAEF